MTRCCGHRATEGMSNGSDRLLLPHGKKALQACGLIILSQRKQQPSRAILQRKAGTYVTASLFSSLLFTIRTTLCSRAAASCWRGTDTLRSYNPGNSNLAGVWGINLRRNVVHALTAWAMEAATTYFLVIKSRLKHLHWFYFYDGSTHLVTSVERKSKEAGHEWFSPSVYLFPTFLLP
jgi:hypothetical protein